jgi:hypothetical protein
VYLAFDKRLDREVALGLIKSEDLDERELAAIWRGAQAMARLSGHTDKCSDPASARGND